LLTGEQASGLMSLDLGLINKKYFAIKSLFN
jgi:hypothetical protein